MGMGFKAERAEGSGPRQEEDMNITTPETKSVAIHGLLNF